MIASSFAAGCNLSARIQSSAAKVIYAGSSGITFPKTEQVTLLSKPNSQWPVVGTAEDAQLLSDNTHIIFRWQKDDVKKKLYRINVNTNTIVDITPSGVKEVESYALTSDTSMIVARVTLISAPGTVLYAMSSDGSNPVKISPDNAANAAGISKYLITPNNLKIVFVSDYVQSGEYKLYSVGIDGSALTYLNPTSVQYTYYGDFVLSPDSQYVAYTASQNQSWAEVFSAKLDGTSNIRLNASAYNGLNRLMDISNQADLQLSPDGLGVIYGARENGTSDLLYKVKFDGTGAGTLKPYNASDTGFNSAAKWKVADGKVFFYMKLQGYSQNELFSINGDSTGLAKLSNNSFNSPTLGLIEVEPTLNKVIFTGEDAGDSMIHLYISNYDGTGRVRLTPVTGNQTGNEQVTSAKFSPDGSKVLFASDCQFMGFNQLHIVNTNGTGYQVLSGLYSIGFNNYGFSPDGTRVYYSIGGGTSSYSIDLGGLDSHSISAVPTLFTATKAFATGVYLNSGSPLVSFDYNGQNLSVLTNTNYRGGTLYTYYYCANKDIVFYSGSQDRVGSYDVYVSDLLATYNRKLNPPAPGSVFFSIQQISDDCNKMLFNIGPDLYQTNVSTGVSTLVHTVAADTAGSSFLAGSSQITTTTTYNLFSSAANLISFSSIVSGTDGGISSVVTNSNSFWVLYRAKTFDESYQYGNYHGVNAITGVDKKLTNFTGTISLQSGSRTEDGQRFIYQANQDLATVYELYSVDVSSGTSTKLHPNGVIGDTINTTYFVLKNNTVFLMRKTPNTFYELYSNKNDGTDFKKLNIPLQAFSSVTNIFKTNNPDFIVYRADQEIDNLYTYYLVQISTGTTKRIMGPFPWTQFVGGFSVSDDQKYVLASGEVFVDGVNEFASVDLDTGVVTRLNGTLPAGKSVTAFLHDAANRRAYYTADEDNDSLIDINLVSEDGSKKKHLTASGFVNVQSPSLIKNGRNLIFMNGSDLVNIEVPEL